MSHPLLLLLLLLLLTHPKGVLRGIGCLFLALVIVVLICALSSH
jgi:hypothetical protein